MATSTISPNSAASCGEPALQPVEPVRLNNVSGLHRDGSNRTRDETSPDYSYFHLNAFRRIALICIAVFNDMVVVSSVRFSCFFSGFKIHPLTPRSRLVHRLFLGEVTPDIRYPRSRTTEVE
jgi:hypothetical protein